MALKKLCPRCNEVIDYSSKYCISCSRDARKDRAENNKAYDENVRRLRDSKYDSFYHSGEWRKTVEVVKNKYKYLDIYSYYILNIIEYGNVSHHIEVLKTDEGWNARLNTNKLIYLTDTNHALIHSLYNVDYDGTKKILYKLINKWIKEMNIYIPIRG